MATTKVITELTDLNQANSESGLRMPTGGAFSGTPVPGMMRNDTTQSSASSASTMQHYNGAEWKNFVNVDSCTLNKCDYPTTGTALYQFDDTADSSCTPAYNGTFTNPSYVASMTGFGVLQIGYWSGLVTISRAPEVRSEVAEPLTSTTCPGWVLARTARWSFV